MAKKPDDNAGEVFFALCIVIVFTCLSGCKIPEKRLGQTTIPPPPQKSPEHLELEKDSAYMLRFYVAPEAQPLADSLSFSLGAPRSLPLLSQDGLQDLIAAWPKANFKFEAEKYKVEKFLVKNEGRAIQGSGFNVLAPLQWLANISPLLVIAALIFFPALIPIVFAWGRSWKRSFSEVIQGVQVHDKIVGDDSPKKTIFNFTSRKTDGKIARIKNSR